MQPCLPLAVLLFLVLSRAAALKVVDMSYTLSKDSVTWPGNDPLNLTIKQRGLTEDGYWLEMNSFCVSEHASTHVDAPAHFKQGQWRADQVPATSLVGPAAVVDVTVKATSDPDYRLTVQDILDWEEQYGQLPERCVVLMNSGWGSRYPDPSRVFNTPTPTDPTTFHFPGFHPDTARFLTSQRSVIALAVDTPSTDFGQSRGYETHIILSGGNALGLENVANVHELPPRGASLVIGLVKLKDGSGAPVRILGLVGSLDTGSAGKLNVDMYGVVLLLVCLLIV